MNANLALERKLNRNVHPRRSTMAAMLLLSCVAVSEATVIHVPSDQLTIGQAIDAATTGDTIMVAAGTYPGDIILGKDLVLLAETYLAVTIDGGGNRLTTGFNLGDLSNATLISGFRITNCGSGGMVLMGGGEPVITNCVVTNCHLAGILCGGPCGATFQNCTSEDNFGPGFRMTLSHVLLQGCHAIGNRGSGIEITDGTDTIDDCIVEGNTATFGGGGIDCIDASPLIHMATICGNEASDGGGGGIWCSGTSNVSIESCTVSRNSASQGGGIYLDGSASAAIHNTILWGNCASSPDNGIELWAGGSAPVTFQCSCVNPAWVIGSGVVYDGEQVTSDPHFCELPPCPNVPTTDGSYMLASDSPALGAACGSMGSWGEGCEVTPIQRATWGRVRQIFR